jgi:hypothetical protein
MADAQASFAINLEGDTSAATAQDAALKKLKSSIEDDMKALKALEAAQKRLSAGSSVNIADHKKLSTEIDATKSRIASSQSGFMKLGGNLSDIGKHARAAKVGIKEAKDGLKEAEEKVLPFGKQVSGLARPLNQISKALGFHTGLGADLKGLGAAFNNPQILMAVLAIGAVVAAVAFVAAAGAAAVYAIHLADAARSNRIYLEAVEGSAEGGKMLGDTIKKLSNDLPLAKEKIQALGVSMVQSGLADDDLTRGMHAAATAASVLGDAAGEKLKSVLERNADATGAMKGKFKATADDFKASGIELDDVANALASNLGVTFKQAEDALKQGRVSMADGTKAIDDAVSNKLGGAAAQLNNSLDAIGKRAKDNFEDLFSGADIEPLLQGLSDAVELLSASSVEGQALREMIAGIMSGFSEFLALATGGSAESFTDYIDDIIIGMLAVEVAFYTAKIAVKKFFQDPIGSIEKFEAKLEAIGQNMMTSLAGAITKNGGKVSDAITGVVGDALTAAKVLLGIKSPSKVFEAMGVNTVAGYAQGVEKESPRAERAVERMVAVPASASGSAPQRASVAAPGVTLNWYGPPPSQDDQVRFRQMLTEALELAARQSGAPVVA